MHDLLKERLMRALETLPEERQYQVLDYAEFLGSRYARDGVGRPASPIQKFSERLQDHMRMQGVGMNAIRSTLDVMGTADRLFSDVADAGRTLFKEVEGGLKPPAQGSGSETEVRSLPRKDTPGAASEG